MTWVPWLKDTGILINLMVIVLIANYYAGILICTSYSSELYETVLEPNWTWTLWTAASTQLRNKARSTWNPLRDELCDFYLTSMPGILSERDGKYLNYILPFSLPINNHPWHISSWIKMRPNNPPQHKFPSDYQSIEDSMPGINYSEPSPVLWLFLLSLSPLGRYLFLKILIVRSG